METKNSLNTNIIHVGDCVAIMNEVIGQGSIDLIYADPPYNLSGKPLVLTNSKTGGPFFKMNEEWDTWSYDAYVTFTKNWLSSAKRILAERGSLYVSCTYHNISEVVFLAKQLGLKLNNILTWYKTNAMPSLTRRTFTHATEYVCWFVQGPGWKFNYQALKELNPRRTREGDLKQMRDFLDFLELPIVQGKERLRNGSGRASHPTQKPEKLLELIVAASSDEGDLVLDPFLGSGTTGAVAQRMGRRWIGIEKDASYVTLAIKRLNEPKVKHHTQKRGLPQTPARAGARER